MGFKEYALENKEPVDISNLAGDFIIRDDFIKIHENSVIVTVDVMVWHEGGFLLVQRDNFPAKGELWNIGGRVERGVNLEEVVKRKVKLECNLNLKNISYLGVARTFWRTDPFGHGKGTDTLTIKYYAEGFGELKLDDLHSKPIIVDKKKFIEIKSSLHPFVSNFMEECFKKIKY